MQKIIDFVRESNAIERIYRDPTQEEIDEFIHFMALPSITVDDLVHFVSIYEPEAKLRSEYGMDVRIANYYPDFGGPELVEELNRLLNYKLNAYHLHVFYEKLHPFTDCNGRSGRALWAWKMQDLTGGFLLNFYYQSLSASLSMNRVIGVKDQIGEDDYA